MHRVVIAGTGSGVGKTTVTIGLMRALMKRGLAVQGFKCGPDYIDPTYHSSVTNRPSRNIDTWMMEPDIVRTIVARASRDADISVIEGAMGLYDGKSPLGNIGSAADISVVTESPVILVINAASMARSAAAVVKGFQLLDENVHIAGVIANQVGSKSHFEIVKTAVEQECSIPVIGYLEKGAVPSLPSRHLGLVPAIERGDLDPYFDELAQVMEQSIDMEKLLTISKTSPLSATSNIFDKTTEATVHIAVARDAAFNFYYEENLGLLRANGANLCFFSPLANEEVPHEAQGLYLGGGFPEEFAEQLSRSEKAKRSIQQAAESLPTLAECGGFMYCTEAIIDRSGKEYPMLGVIPGKVRMQEKLAALGYREITGMPNNFLLSDQELVKGHEFHYSVYEGNNNQPAYTSKGRFKTQEEGYLKNRLTAGYAHMHFASNPQLVRNWIKACREVTYESISDPCEC
ncbi:cobyrinic acid a,c-diamide synthase [Bacillus ectoiniformans]|uniref:cobyrinate a,c-diamide synthase n=1 Tax=Bacillus ectoiniformans TaxID=1494429 RepID=UPI00195884E2|nr:cobyrinate a,c-diamide synthase [Bacillus ectoiniformans]MBM7647822.1 cobyrinic acid a,c-diamide synthase [Bacillus ectoiniformans]